MTDDERMAYWTLGMVGRINKYGSRIYHGKLARIVTAPTDRMYGTVSHTGEGCSLPILPTADVEIIGVDPPVTKPMMLSSLDPADNLTNLGAQAE
jgi:hypothetical protein